MGSNNSTNMNLPVPQVGNEAGPQYAIDINNCLTLIDQHDHSPGYGVQVTPSGININQDFNQQDNNIINPRSVRFYSQSGALATPSDLNCAYVVSDDLYFNDGVGNQIRITQSGGVAGTPGSISNLVSPASASYSVSTKTFIWQSAALTPANLDAASIVLRNLVASSNGLTLAPPSAMAADYTLTLPSLPGSTLPISVSATGVMSAAQITLAQLAAAIQQALVPSGVIAEYGGTVAPSGYLMCDGTSYLRSDYPTLFAAIGTAFGAADGTHFNVPDKRGLFTRGVDGAAGRDPDSASRTALYTGGNTGNNVGSYQADDFASHTHSFNSGSAAGGSGQSGLTGSPTTTGSTGGNETRPKNVYVNYIIKT